MNTRLVNGRKYTVCEGKGNCIMCGRKMKNDSMVCKSNFPESDSRASRKIRHKVTPRTTEQCLQIIALHCWSCPESSHRGDYKDLRTINCPNCRGCNSSRLKPMMDKLKALTFKCHLEKRLDSKLEDIQDAIKALNSESL